jgi:peptidoglycan lytic transglycosylase D
MKLLNSRIYFFSLGIVSAIAAMFLISSVFLIGEKNPLKTPRGEDYPQGYRIIVPEMPSSLEFAGERIPTENFEVKERMEREFIVNTYFHSYTILAIKRSVRWFPVIEPILKNNGVPDDFKYLCVAESNMENVTSSAGATGFWQFLKATAQKYGLEVNDQVDERYSVEKSTEAACKYLLDAYQKFGSWITAAAAFNMGTEGTDNQLDRQKADNYFNLVLGTETSRYVGRIVALKYIMNNAEKYGFDVNEIEGYQPLKYSEITLDGSVKNFSDFADRYGMNYKTLKYYNPWLRDTTLENKNNKSYKIKIPE